MSNSDIELDVYRQIKDGDFHSSSKPSHAVAISTEQNTFVKIVLVELAKIKNILGTATGHYGLDFGQSYRY